MGKQITFLWHILSVIFVPKITGIGQLLVVEWYRFFETHCIDYITGVYTQGARYLFLGSFHTENVYFKIPFQKSFAIKCIA